MRWFDCSLDETIIDNHMLNEVWRELTPAQRERTAKASAMLVIPDKKVQRRAYVFIEPEHRFVGVFDPQVLGTKGYWVLNALLVEPAELSIYVLENTAVVDFYRVNV